MSIENEKSRDPRGRLIREKYFSIRPRPLERWLWSQGIPASAERVFWLHWQEGMQRGDWCSEIPLKRVARDCELDVSTVTRAYQLLGRMGCIRRTDPGRNPANPFQQATALTEVRLPRELLMELDRHPNRRTKPREIEEIETQSVHQEEGGQPAAGAAEAATPIAAGDLRSSDPLSGLRGRDRVRALEALTQPMSASERKEYQTAMRLHRVSMAFDLDSKLTQEARGVVLRVLASMAVAAAKMDKRPSISESCVDPKAGRRRLSVFELARLKCDIQAATSSIGGAELLRQVLWSIEAGALRRFSPLHAAHIALKKIRGGAWTRPHRMPAHWNPDMSTTATTETCRAA